MNRGYTSPGALLEVILASAKAIARANCLRWLAPGAYIAHMDYNENILGVVLAGGGSRRMFTDKSTPGDKALIDLAGTPMIARVARCLAPQVKTLIINANGDAARFASLGVPIVADLDDSRDGPLAGLAAAFAWAANNHAEVSAIVTVSTDTPFLPADLVSQLFDAACGRPAIAVSNGRRHPAIGLWPITLRDAVGSALRDGQRRVEHFAQHHEAVEVVFPFGDIGGRRIDPFFNVNTPEDAEVARAVLTASPH